MLDCFSDIILYKVIDWIKEFELFMNSVGNIVN